MAFVWMAVLCVATVLVFLFDVAYFIRVVISLVASSIRNRKDYKHLLETSETYDICLTPDLDFMCHMNNARYLRSADFARFALWMERGVWAAMKDLRGHMVLGASSIRYRKSLELGQLFKVQCRILCWDERAFYVEQRWVRHSDGFVCAVGLAKQSVVGNTTAEVLETLERLTGNRITPPEVPRDVSLWIEANQISSDHLKKQR